MPNGYPQDWILGGNDIAKDISEDMVCSICSDFKRDAVITDCKHSFCGECISTWFQAQRSGTQTCPNCRAPHFNTFVTPDVPMRAIIDAMHAKCPHCPFTDKLPSVFLHESGCASRPPPPPTPTTGAATLTNIAQMQLAMEALRVQVGANGRSCRCRVCAATSDSRLSSFLTAATAAIELPANVVRLVVVSAPAGKDFFFVAQEGAVRHRNSNAFIHMSTYTTIVNALRTKYSCTDRTPITRPSPGAVFVGVLGQDGRGHRVDVAATEIALTGRRAHTSASHFRHLVRHRHSHFYNDEFHEDMYDNEMYHDDDSDMFFDHAGSQEITSGLPRPSVNALPLTSMA